MTPQTTRAAEVTALAGKFRQRAAEAGDLAYRALMLRTAGELEELAASLLQDCEPQDALLEGIGK